MIAYMVGAEVEVLFVQALIKNYFDKNINNTCDK